MGSVKEYFSSLTTGFLSLLKGMSVTGREFVTPKLTENYPDNRKDPNVVADRFRAVLTLKYDENGQHKCIGCGICQRNCPNGSIEITKRIVTTPEGKKKTKLDKHIYDLGSCTFCRLCVTTCPQDALEFSNEFEQAVFTREKLVKQLNYIPEKEEEPSIQPTVPMSKPAKIDLEKQEQPAQIEQEESENVTLARQKIQSLQKLRKVDVTKLPEAAAQKTAQKIVELENTIKEIIANATSEEKALILKDFPQQNV